MIRAERSDIQASFIIVIHSNCQLYFLLSMSGMQRTGKRTYRKNNFFEKEFDVDHITGWSVLWFSGEFTTRLRVTEAKRSGRLHFKLLSSDIMKDFDGEWTLKPCTQQALDKMYGKDDFNPLRSLQGASRLPRPHSAASVLAQHCSHTVSAGDVDR